jgi:acetoin utilization deacetylase AcuC-like enzyme
MNIYFNENYTACNYAFDTTRKSEAIADSLAVTPIKGTAVMNPQDSFKTAEIIIKRMHDRRYVNAVQTGTPEHLAQSQGFPWDEGMYDMAVSHNSGLVAAVDSVLIGKDNWAGSLSSGLHHAKEENGDGFCTFNGLAVAAQRAFDLGARNILVIDFDAHCGGGTYSMTRSLPVTQIDVSTSSFDRWAKDADDKWSDLTFSSPEDYLKKIKDALERATFGHKATGGWDFVLYNAGMDPVNTGVDSATLNKRESLVARWLGDLELPSVVAIAGGYTERGITMQQLVDLHRLTFANFAKWYK